MDIIFKMKCVQQFLLTLKCNLQFPTNENALERFSEYGSSL